METFNWAAALEYLRDGKWVRATYWSEWGLYLSADLVRSYRVQPGKRFIFLHTIEGEKLHWRSRPFDLDSAEWVLVDNAMIADLTRAPDDDIVWYRGGQTRNDK